MLLSICVSFCLFVCVRLSVSLSVHLFVAVSAEVCFYDAVETVEDLALVSADTDADSEGVAGLRQSVDPRLRRLHARLVNICQRKASIRNKKVHIIVAMQSVRD